MSGNRLTVADSFHLAGFAMFVSGLGAYSLPLAFVIGGAVLFVVGGLASRRSG